MKDRSSDDVSIMEFFDRVLLEHEKAHHAEHEADKLLSKELERRLEDLNRLRQEVVHDRGLFVTTSTYEAKHQALIDRTERIAADLEERRGLLEAAVDKRIFEAVHRLNEIEKALASTYVTKTTVDALHDVGDKRLNDENTRIAALENFRAKATLIATGLVILGGIVGATILKVLMGG